MAGGVARPAAASLLYLMIIGIVALVVDLVYQAMRFRLRVDARPLKQCVVTVWLDVEGACRARWPRLAG